MSTETMTSEGVQADLATHTPGPWKASGLHVTEVDRSTGIEDRAMYIVAKGSRAQANARLIAAAPDLLAALKHCVIERNEWMEEARAAIAKAEGRAALPHP